MTEDVKTEAEASKRTPLTVKQKFALWTFITQRYKGAGVTDAEFAVLASEHVERPIAGGTLRYYREELGIEQYKAASPAEMRQRIAALEKELAAKNAGEKMAQAVAAIPLRDLDDIKPPTLALSGS